MTKCPDCNPNGGEGPRCLQHEKEFVIYEIRCGLERLEEICKEEKEDNEN